MVKKIKKGGAKSKKSKGLSAGFGSVHVGAIFSWRNHPSFGFVLWGILGKCSSPNMDKCLGPPFFHQKMVKIHGVNHHV
jgi:hypothetical protein